MVSCEILVQEAVQGCAGSSVARGLLRVRGNIRVAICHNLHEAIHEAIHEASGYLSVAALSC